jgi:hypothetical protein
VHIVQAGGFRAQSVQRYHQLCLNCCDHCFPARHFVKLCLQK